MAGCIRLAGVVEFGGLDAGPRKAPIDLLKRKARDLVPDLTYEPIDDWLGHRPTTANRLPLIGRLDKYDNVLVGFGHQHIGLTSGPKWVVSSQVCPATKHQTLLWKRSIRTSMRERWVTIIGRNKK